MAVPTKPATKAPTPTERWETKRRAAARVKREITERGVGSVEWICAKMFVVPKTVRAWAGGTRWPSYTMALRILDTLG